MAEKVFKCSIRADKVTGLDLPVDPSDAASKAYVDSQSGVGALSLLPFWKANGTKECILLSGGYLPFWKANGTLAPIPIGC